MRRAPGSVRGSTVYRPSTSVRSTRRAASTPMATRALSPSLSPKDGASVVAPCARRCSTSSRMLTLSFSLSTGIARSSSSRISVVRTQSARSRSPGSLVEAELLHAQGHRPAADEDDLSALETEERHLLHQRHQPAERERPPVLGHHLGAQLHDNALRVPERRPRTRLC